jgi:hypothetical protein
MARLALDRSEHAGMLGQTDGGYFSTGYVTRYLPRLLSIALVAKSKGGEMEWRFVRGEWGGWGGPPS